MRTVREGTDVSLLSDYSIRQVIASRHLVIDPTPAEEAIQPASVDLTLGSEFRRYRYRIAPDIMDISRGGIEEMDLVDREEFYDDAYMLDAGAFVLAHTAEWIRLGRSLAAQVEGRSSLGRVGLFVHCTAGFIDPGFAGQVTLELFNASPRAVLLRPGMGIAQLVLHRLTSTSLRAYGDAGLGSKYQGQTGAIGSRYGQTEADSEQSPESDSIGVYAQEMLPWRCSRPEPHARHPVGRYCCSGA